MVAFNIVHLTDLHFGSVPNRPNILGNKIRRSFGSIWKRQPLIPPTHNVQRTERVAAWLHQLAETLESGNDKIDSLVLSGDLATTGLQGDLDAAFAYIDTAPSYLHFRAAVAGQRRNDPHLATIAGLSPSYFLVPGNHDRFRNNQCDAGGTLFDQVFASYWGHNKHGVIRSILQKPAASADPDKIERLAIIGADGCLRRNSDAGLTHKSQGMLYPDTLNALVDETNEVRKEHPGIAVIWVIHFPPHASVPRLEALLDYDGIELASSQLDVAIILSGHTHENRVYPTGRGSAIWNGGSAAQFGENKGHWIQFLKIEVANNRFVGARRTNFKWKIQNNVYDYFQDGSDTLP